MFSLFYRLRNKVAKITETPRIRQISPNSFRHWSGTMLVYYSNGNVQNGLAVVASTKMNIVNFKVRA